MKDDIYLTASQFDAELERCLNCPTKPCLKACPVSCSPCDFIAHAKIIAAQNPLGETCGLICPNKFCVRACLRQYKDSPIRIPAVQAEIMRRARLQKLFFPLPIVSLNNHKIAIIGAGPAGIQAAFTLAEKGYDVTIFEKSDKIGGSVNLANKAPGKFRMDLLLDYWKGQLAKNEKIKVILNTEINDEKIAEIKETLNPKVVCLNVGGKPVIPNMQGLQNAVTAHDVLSGKVTVEGKRCVIIGGGMTALETAEFMVERGNTIVLCEMTPQFAADTFIYRVAKTQLWLANHGVAMKPSTLVTGANEEGVLYKDLVTGLEGVLPAEVIVLSLGVRPDKTLRDRLTAAFDNVIVLGDSNQTGTLQNATGNTFHRLKRI